MTRKRKLGWKGGHEDEREEGPWGSCVQALNLRATVHISGLRAGPDVVTGALLVDTDSPFLHRQERVHRIHRSCQEAKYLQNTGTVSPRTISRRRGVRAGPAPSGSC